VGLTPTGYLLLRTDSTYRPTVAVTALRADGDRADTLFTVSGPILLPIQTRVRGNLRTETVVPHFSVGDIVSVRGDGFVVPRDGPFVIDWRDRRGGVRRQLVVAARRRPVTEAMRNAQLSREVALYTGLESERHGPDSASLLHQVTSESRFVDSLPAVGALIPLANGSFWAVAFHAAGAVGWSAALIGIDGTIHGRIESASSGEPIAFGADRVVMARDRVVRCALRPGAPSLSSRRRH
jgi:hypothetical protein